MRMEPPEIERLDATAMRQTLEDECPDDLGPLPPALVEPERHRAWMRAHGKLRRARADLLRQHGWDLLSLMSAELDLRFSKKNGPTPP